ncbi:unnamed protein product [Orchesella dallaii]|uniref:Uncharacterized protein n=1 Tax=Orchesella dallaii TaxID=48710 RepID=A0ABP1RVC1_9HEXA
MRCGRGRILIFLCQALYLVGKIQAQGLDDAVDGATDTVDDTSSAGCDSVDTATDAVDDADGGSRIPFSMLNGNNIEEILLGDRLSIIELYYYEKGENWTTDLFLPRNYVENQFQACNTNKSGLYKEKLITAIKKVLQFYSSHEDVALKEPGDLIGLSILKGVEDKHGMQFKRAHNVSTWLTGTCSQVTTKRKEFCTKLTQIWKQREGNHWKSKDVINSIRNSSVAAVGHEMEYNVRTLNAHCQHALLTRCQVPHVCERTLYDPTPRAQYYLAKQVLQRIFTEQVR